MNNYLSEKDKILCSDKLWPQIRLVRQHICKNCWQMNQVKTLWIRCWDKFWLQIHLFYQYVYKTCSDKSSEEKFGAKIHLNTGFISTVVDLSVSDK